MKKKIVDGLIIILSLAIIGIVSYLFLFSKKTIEIERIQLNKNQLTLVIGTSEKLEATILPENATDKTLIWESKDSNIVSVNNNGEIYANNIGNTIISVKNKDGNIKSQCLVYVEKKKIENIIFDKTNIELDIGSIEVLSINIYPEELNDDIVSWSSSDPNIVTVNKSGQIEAISEGTATITVTSSDGTKSASCIVNVLGPPVILVTDISLETSNLVLGKGAKTSLSVKVMPDDATNKDITWLSNNPNIVSVENGVLSAKTVGETTISVTTVDGNKTALCNVKVVDINLFNQQNSVIWEYFNNPSNLKRIYSSNKCKKDGSCTIPNNYKTLLIGEIKLYQYNINDNTKEYITTVDGSVINYYLYPGKTYYLESKNDSNKVEIVTVIGSLRVINGSVANFRDLGGWMTDEGTTINYGKLYRSASTDKLSENIINILNIKRIVDLRASGASSSATAASKAIRKVVGVSGYKIDKSSKVREAVTEIMSAIVDGKNVVFNCAIGRDRTGTVAYTIEGILGVTVENRNRDYEISYFTYPEYDRVYIERLNSQFKYDKFKYDQERFINWYLSSALNKYSDLDLINQFRKKMIDGNPQEYKLSNGTLVLS